MLDLFAFLSALRKELGLWCSFFGGEPGCHLVSKVLLTCSL